MKSGYHHAPHDYPPSCCLLVLMASPTNGEATTFPETPEGVARLVRVLTELTHLEVPPLTGYDGEMKTLVNLYSLDHPFGQVWRDTVQLLKEHLGGVRVGKASLDSTDPDAMVYCRSTRRDNDCQVSCSVAMYADGSRNITARYSTPSDWENQTFGTAESYEQTFIKTERGDSLIDKQIRAAVEATPWGSDQ